MHSRGISPQYTAVSSSINVSIDIRLSGSSQATYSLTADSHPSGMCKVVVVVDVGIVTPSTLVTEPLRSLPVDDDMFGRSTVGVIVMFVLLSFILDFEGNA